MHSCGTPVFKVRVKEVWLSNLTVCILLVRKSIIQLHREVLMPKSLTLVISLEGLLVLSRWERAV